MTSPTSKRLLYIGVLIFVTFLAWFLFQINPNVKFQQFKKQFWKEYSLLFIKNNTLDIPDHNQLIRQEKFIIKQTEASYAFKVSKLNQSKQNDWNNIWQTLQKQKKALQAFRTDPSLYNLGGLLKGILVNKKQNPAEKWQDIEPQLQAAARYYIMAKENLRAPNAEKSKLAIEKQLLTLRFLQTELLDSLTKANLPEPQRQSILQNSTQAQIAVKDYLAFCRSLQFEHQDSMFTN